MAKRIQIGLILFGLLIAFVAACFAADQRAARTGRTRLEAAAWSAYVATRIAHQDGRADVEDIYRWSLRIKKAELSAGKANAADDHLERMRELNLTTKAKYLIGAASSSDYHWTIYFVLAASSKSEQQKPAK